MNNTNGYCLILAGGIGSRLWPVSRVSKPKQFLDLFGTGRTLLQQTYDRFAKFIAPENIYIATNEQYLTLVQEQIPELASSQILVEPLRRGTMASTAWGVLTIAAKRNAQANIIMSPADQLILNEQAFEQDILRALQFVDERKALLSLGIRPTRPDTGYGYIQVGNEAGWHGNADGENVEIYEVKSFTEKPKRQFAEMLMQTGEFYWNAGLFIFSVQKMLHLLKKLSPEYEVELPRMMAELSNTEPQHIPEFFTSLPKHNIDRCILEESHEAYVQLGHFGWADLGTWGSLHTDSSTNDDENLLLDTSALLNNCHGNIIRMPKGRTVIIDSLDNYVVVEEGDVLAIAPKTNEAALRRLMNDAQMQLGIE